MRTRTFALLLALGLSVAAPVAASAREGDTDRQVTAGALKQRSARVNQQLHVRRVGAVERQQVHEQRRLIQDLIERLDAGQSVAPSDVERALGH